MSLALPGIQARIGRLESLARGLAQEGVLWQKDGDPLHDSERRLYLAGLMDALAGVEQARTVLVNVVNRLEHHRDREQVERREEGT
jgi:hypothetical protein